MQHLMQSLLKFLEFYASLETYPYNKVKKQAFLSYIYITISTFTSVCTSVVGVSVVVGVVVGVGVGGVPTLKFF